MDDTYDFVMAGGGAAGLSLAYHLRRNGFVDERVLIIDKDDKRSNDRTWCFWSADETDFDQIAAKRWSKLAVIAENTQVLELAPYTYTMVRGVDFYGYVKEFLSRDANTVFLTAVVDEIRDGDAFAEVVADGRTYQARWVFDSFFVPRNFTVDTKKYHFLKQHFTGWFIETESPEFDPETVSWFDFRTPQNNEMRFMYVLPESPTRALVEFTLFSADLLSEEQYENALKAYVHGVLDIDRYVIHESEHGVIPMTEQPFPRRGGRRIMYTGTKAGRVKASTGFAFNRIQKDSLAIVASLKAYGHPFRVKRAPRRYRVFDTILLQIMYRRGGESKDVFTRLFRKNSIHRLFRFLDEESSIRDDLAIMVSVRWGLFIGAWFRTRILRKI
ncbi:MAG: Lycopene cyclase [Spirochaetaceae bacterium]|nr:MAG: Lycopene cyclase [Spirochaetaceae bacterium]